MIRYTFSMSIRMSLWDGWDMYVNQLKVSEDISELWIEWN